MVRVTVAYLLAFGTATAWLVRGPDTDRVPMLVPRPPRRNRP